MPVAEFPQITPPQVSVTTAYPGANAQTLVDAVAGPIEQRVNGAEGMIYMQSTSADDGSYTLNVTFDFGIDPDQAQVNVQNLVSQAEPILPEEVKRQGVTVRKQSTDILMVVNVYSPDESLSPEFISNYTSINVADVLARVDGVAEARSLGALDYGMRIWLDPDRMAAIGLTVEDVVAAIREQNVEVAVGQIGAPPIPEGQQFQYTLTAQGRLESVEEFERIVVRAGGGARIVYLKDIARVELGVQNYAWRGELDGVPSAVIAIYMLPDANALEVAERVRSAIRAVRGDEGRADVRCSVGLATWPQDGPTRDDLLLAADRALYAAKRSGRDRVGTAVDGLALAAEFVAPRTPVDELEPGAVT